MNKLVLSTLAVMTAVSICGMQPVDAKQVKPDSTMIMLQMPKNDEISVGNGTTQEINKQTQSLVNNVAVSTRSMIKKHWKTIYIKAIPSDNTVRFYYTDTMGQVYSGQTIKNTGLSKGVSTTNESGNSFFYRYYRYQSRSSDSNHHELR